MKIEDLKNKLTEIKESKNPLIIKEEVNKLTTSFLNYLTSGDIDEDKSISFFKELNGINTKYITRDTENIFRECVKVLKPIVEKKKMGVVTHGVYKCIKDYPENSETEIVTGPFISGRAYEVVSNLETRKKWNREIIKCVVLADQKYKRFNIPFDVFFKYFENKPGGVSPVLKGKNTIEEEPTTDVYDNIKEADIYTCKRDKYKNHILQFESNIDYKVVKKYKAVSGNKHIVLIDSEGIKQVDIYYESFLEYFNTKPINSGVVKKETKKEEKKDKGRPGVGFIKH